jgi:uncharacterized NAD(P)/FAD-binding protein YdhS
MEVVVIGGGLSGALLALKLRARCPNWHSLLVDTSGRPGRGTAYGACAPYHLLNVPVQRLEVGLAPSFGDWLLQLGGNDLSSALVESGGALAEAFMPRGLFGAYIEERLADARSTRSGEGLETIRGEVVALLDAPKRGVLLRDGRELLADIIILATGNLPPKAPLPTGSRIQDAAEFVVDPWTTEATAGLDADALVVLIGTGLTMVDIAIKLQAEGHRGAMHAVSRRGLIPLDHCFGGDWSPFVAPMLPASPVTLMRAVRNAAASAEARGVPWQRVVDAVRPAIGRVWLSWDSRQRRQFLRHLRPYWDVHRHRMAPRIAKRLQELIASGSLTIWSGGIVGFRKRPSGIDVDVSPRTGGESRTLKAARIINCTGPRSDLGAVGIPIFTDLRRRKLIKPDVLVLGIETDNCAVLDSSGLASSWLFAVGPLTRPAWWEITAVPEIAAQIDRLVIKLTNTKEDHVDLALVDTFNDLGAGI